MSSAEGTGPEGAWARAVGRGPEAGSGATSVCETGAAIAEASAGTGTEDVFGESGLMGATDGVVAARAGGVTFLAADVAAMGAVAFVTGATGAGAGGGVDTRIVAGAPASVLSSGGGGMGSAIATPSSTGCTASGTTASAPAGRASPRPTPSPIRKRWR